MTEAPARGGSVVPGSVVPGDALRADALHALRGWPAPTPEQERLRVRYVRHLEAHDPATHPGAGVLRESVPDHLTASAVVLSHDGAHVLLTLHAKAQRWFQLGGHLEPGDRTLAGAAQREAREESGLALTVDPVAVHLDEHVVPFCRPGTGDPDRPVHHLDVRFVAVAAPGAEALVSDESLDVRWWPADALPDPDLTELVALARTRVGGA
ncbi:NUDIX hydrolase [Promicromonospora sp. MS192]|uniref:NUDIX hydrolase n=1 Tax=Promicromonospora sp. MS192 TaxID=3412684 RepID=UPI003C2D19D7